MTIDKKVNDYNKKQNHIDQIYQIALARQDFVVPYIIEYYNWAKIYNRKIAMKIMNRAYR